MSDDAPGPPWTILKILEWTTQFFTEKGIDTPRLDAEVLLADTLDFQRIQLYARFDRPMADEELAHYRSLVKRRAAREPVSHICGHREFWSLDFQVDANVLTPRPDTEVLIQETLDRIAEFDDPSIRVADIGTGSGVIAVVLATEYPDLELWATDIDTDALDIARGNATAHDVDDRIHFAQGDLLDALPDDGAPFDIIVSNPPYIADDERDDLPPEVRDFEPPQALFSGDDGLDHIRRLIPESLSALRPGGWLIFELGHQQGAAVEELLREYPFDSIGIRRDFGERDRVAHARRQPS